MGSLTMLNQLDQRAYVLDPAGMSMEWSLCLKMLSTIYNGNENQVFQSNTELIGEMLLGKIRALGIMDLFFLSISYILKYFQNSKVKQFTETNCRLVISIFYFQNTVEPQFNEHPWDQV